MSYVVTGNTGVAFASVSNGSISVTSDLNGNFQISCSGAVTLTPTLAGYTFTPVSAAVFAAGYVVFTASNSSAWSPVDSRATPNSTLAVQGSQIDVVPTKQSHAPEVDSRVGIPVDDRKASNIPQNSRKIRKISIVLGFGKNFGAYFGGVQA